MEQPNSIQRGKYTLIGLFDQGNQAEEAIRDLKENGFDPHTISVITRDQPSQEAMIEAVPEGTTVEKAHEGETVVAGSLGGGTLGAVIGWLLAGGTALIPGVGPVVAAGIFGATVGGALIGGAMGGVTGALVEAGIPGEEAQEYEASVKEGRTLVAVNVLDARMLQSAKVIFRRNGENSRQSRYYDLEQKGPGQALDQETTPSPEPVDPVTHQQG